MNLQDIKQIILDHPELNYTQIKKQAMSAGIAIDDFNDAWNDYLESTKKESTSTVASRIYIGFLVIFSLIAFDFAYWQVFLFFGTQSVIQKVGLLGLLGAFILIMHISSRLVGATTTIGKTTQLSVFIFIALYFAQLLMVVNNQLAYFVAIFGLGFLILITLFIINRTYQLGLARGIVFLLIITIFSIVLLQFTYGLSQFKQDYLEIKNSIEAPTNRNDQIEEVFRR